MRSPASWDPEPDPTDMPRCEAKIYSDVDPLVAVDMRCQNSSTAFVQFDGRVFATCGRCLKNYMSYHYVTRDVWLVAKIHQS